MTDHSAKSPPGRGSRSATRDAVTRLLERASTMVPDQDDPIMDATGTARLDWVNRHYVSQKGELRPLADDAGDAAEDVGRHGLAGDIRAFPEALERFMAALLEGEGQTSAWDALAALWERVEDAAERLPALPPSEGASATSDGLMREAKWFAKATDESLYPDLLRGWWNDGHILGHKSSSRRNRYSVPSVMDKAPEYRGLLQRALDAEARQSVPERAEAKTPPLRS